MQKQIDNLTQKSVSILTVIDGQNHRRAYVNSLSGREELKDLSEEMQEEIIKVWGDTPTVEDPVLPVIDQEPQPPTETEKLWDTVRFLLEADGYIPPTEEIL